MESLCNYDSDDDNSPSPQREVSVSYLFCIYMINKFLDTIYVNHILHPYIIVRTPQTPTISTYSTILLIINYDQ